MIHSLSIPLEGVHYLAVLALTPHRSSFFLSAETIFLQEQRDANEPV